MEYLTMFLAFLPTVLYAAAGLVDARNKGEELKGSLFIKTLLVGAVAVGLVSTQTGDLLVGLVTSTTLSVIIDKSINSLLKKK